jgi:hypothetical protein
LSEGYQKTLLKFAQDPTKTIDDYANCGDTLTGIFSQITNMETLHGRFEAAYSFLGLQKSADLMQLVGSALNDQLLPCRLWMFWPRETFRV